jgi:viologen exporter family transport system permease protein
MALETIALYLRLVAAQLRGQMQYKVSFLLALAGSFLGSATEFGVVLVVFTRVPLVAGWSIGEVALLYGIAGLSFSAAELFASALDNFQVHIVLGTFDRVLVRPRGALLQVMSEDFALRRIGRVAQAVLVLLVATRLLDTVWTPDRLVVLGAALLSGTAIYFAIFVISATFCFWTVQGKEATHVLTYGGDQFAIWPLDIYAGAVRRLFTFVVPLAFVSYEPALYMLGRTDPFGLPDIARLLSPLAALAMIIVARLAWNQGIRHYQSTGS